MRIEPCFSWQDRRMVLRALIVTCVAVGSVWMRAAPTEAGSIVVPAWAFDRGNSSALRGRCRAAVAVRHQLGDMAGDILRHHPVPHPPAGHRVSLGEAVEDDAELIHPIVARQAVEFLVETFLGGFPCVDTATKLSIAHQVLTSS